MSAYESLIDALRERGQRVVENGHGKATAQCPSHDDGRASLSVSPRRDGKGAVLFCHAGCQTPDVVAALGKTMVDLFDDEPMRAAYNDRNVHDYPDGRKVHRKPGKHFHQSGNTKGTALFHADRVTADTTTVYVTEGEKDVLAVESVGGVAVCSAMGAGKAAKFDWSVLKGKRVVVVADKDEPGRKHAAEVVGLLGGIAESVTLLEAATGKDAADHIAAGHALDELVQCAPVDTSPSGREEDVSTEDEKPQRRSVAAQLVDMAREHYRLGVTDTDDPFGVAAERPHIALMLRGGKTGLRAELSRRYFADTNTVASQQALADACMVLEGFAAQGNPQRVYLRVAEQGGAVYIDMGDTVGSVIEISGGKWRVVDTAPVLFRRTKLTGVLPHPQAGKGTRLWDFIRVAPADRPILLAVLVAALIQVDVPHVILLLLAEQGSAKSTITRILVSLVDPSAVALRQPPRDPDGWTTAAAASWVVALDNMSGDIPGWLSDCLCRASTGDGSVKRALYTDSDVSVLAFRRCIIVNGVDVVMGQGDLADRAAIVGLPRVQSRRSEDELAAEWEAARPAVFGSLLDLAAKVQYRLPSVEVVDMPRMADFAKVLAAVDGVLGTKGLDRYRERAQRAAADTLDVPFIAELVAAGRSFEDATSAELLAELKPANPDWKPPRGWPKNARAVTGLLTRHAPALRAQGWHIDNDEGRNIQNRVRWTIRQPEKVCNPDSSNSSAQVNGHKSNELGDELGTRHNDRITRRGSSNSSTAAPVTSGNEETRQTSQESLPSLVLCGCGAELVSAGSLLAGRCRECVYVDRQAITAEKVAGL